MSTIFPTLVEDYLEMRRSLGYRLNGREYQLRRFGRFLDHLQHRGPITTSLALRWAADPATGDPCQPARRLSAIRDFLRHLAVRDGATEVPPPGILGPISQRKAPHVYSEEEITALLQAAAELSPPGGLRPHTYVTLFSLLLCTGLRISEAIDLSRSDVDLTAGIVTVRSGKGGKTRLVPLHPTALEPLQRYATRRGEWIDAGASEEFFFRTERSARLNRRTVSWTFGQLRRTLGWTAEGRTRRPRIHDTRHRFVVRRLLLWHEQGVDVDNRIPALATYLGHVLVSSVYWYLTAVPELMAVVGQRFRESVRRQPKVAGS
ncbi:MAG: integrase [Acidobacteria bacterium]|nr:MAG: integrase [Acidobacteriota bacterium]